MTEAEVPIVRLTNDPITTVALLVVYAGVKTCRNPKCDVRWVGGNGNRLYCSEDCKREARRARV